MERTKVPEAVPLTAALCVERHDIVVDRPWSLVDEFVLVSNSAKGWVLRFVKAPVE